jgi:hypothetical protein
MRTDMCGKQYIKSQNKDFACSSEKEPDLRASEDSVSTDRTNRQRYPSPSAFGMIILLRHIGSWVPGKKMRWLTD